MTYRTRRSKYDVDYPEGGEQWFNELILAIKRRGSLRLLPGLVGTSAYPSGNGEWSTYTCQLKLFEVVLIRHESMYRLSNTDRNSFT
jgi:hypothetical protein